MEKNNLKMLLIMMGLAVIISGCVGGPDTSLVVKAIPEVQEYMAQHPDAEITVTYWSEEEVAGIVQEISQQCDKTVVPVALYKAVINDGDLKVTSWINAEKQVVVCSITENTSQTQPSTSNPTPTPLQTPTQDSIQTSIGADSDVQASTQISSSVNVPDASITAGNYLDTPEVDMVILHGRGDTLIGGEWKISVVPLGAPPKYITSSRSDDISMAHGILVLATTESVPFLVEDVLAGDVLLIPDTSYDVKLLHIPSNVLLLDTIVEVSGSYLTEDPFMKVTALTAGIIPSNFPETPEPDIKIVHIGGDVLNGGEWKISIVPYENQPVYITSDPESELSTGDQIVAATTTQGATGLTDTALTGREALVSGEIYSVKMVHIPTNTMVVDMAVEVEGTEAN